MSDLSINRGIVNSNAQINTKAANTEENKVEENVAAKPETKNVSEKDTFAYMSANALYNQASVKLSPQALVNKYNSPEAIARIEAMMGDFEDGVVAGLAKFEEEMGQAPAYKGLSDADKMALGAQWYASEAL